VEEVIASARLANMACKVSVSAKLASAVLASSSQRDRRLSQVTSVPRTLTFRGPIPTFSSLDPFQVSEPLR